MVTIITQENPNLRKKSEPVSDDFFATDTLRSILQDLEQALAKERFGVAIAAPQIDVLQRIFIVDNKAIGKDTTQSRYTHFINPRITNTSKKMRQSLEGCLSVPGKAGTVMRHKQITIEYQDEYGKKHTTGASDFFAAVIQHEYDHLDGILYIDKAEEVHDVDENMEPINKSDTE